MWRVMAMQSRDSMSLTERARRTSPTAVWKPCKALHGAPRESASGMQNAGEKNLLPSRAERREKRGQTPPTIPRPQANKQTQQASRPPRILGVQKARPRLHGFGVQKASKATQAARVLCAERNENKPTATRATVCGVSWLCRAVTPCH